MKKTAFIISAAAAVLAVLTIIARCIGKSITQKRAVQESEDDELIIEYCE